MRNLRDELRPDAEKYRLWQAKQLLLECGFVEQPNGTWTQADES